MKTKILYVLVSNGGDGSAYAQYTFNQEFVKNLEQQDEDGTLDYERWADGDGFHYDELHVPVECTLESLGIRYDCAESN